MKYIVEFWNPWASKWQRWNMEPVEEWRAELMLLCRSNYDPTLKRRIVPA